MDKINKKKYMSYSDDKKSEFRILRKVVTDRNEPVMYLINLNNGEYLFFNKKGGLE